MEYFTNFLNFQKDFINPIKENLCEILLKNSICQEKQIFTLSFKIFLLLVYNYKEHVKSEIVLFIEQIFLKILSSGNSSFSHRYSSLQVIAKICYSPKTLLEFFVNYDCDIGHFNAIEKIIEILGKIAQGKYSKSEYSLVIQPEQEVQLRNLALESLVQMMNALDKFLDELENPIGLKDDGKSTDIAQMTDFIDQNYAVLDSNTDMNVIDPEKLLYEYFLK